MTRKRFIKKLMWLGVSRNEARKMAKVAQKHSYLKEMADLACAVMETIDNKSHERQYLASERDIVNDSIDEVLRFVCKARKEFGNFTVNELYLLKKSMENGYILPLTPYKFSFEMPSTKDWRFVARFDGTVL